MYWNRQASAVYALDIKGNEFLSAAYELRVCYAGISRWSRAASVLWPGEAEWMPAGRRTRASNGAEDNYLATNLTKHGLTYCWISSKYRLHSTNAIKRRVYKYLSAA